MPSTDEIDFLRAGLEKATLQLKQKDLILSQLKAQIQEFQKLQDQLLEAKKQIQHKDEDLKYKNMALTRLEDISRTRESDLKNQVMILTRKPEFKSSDALEEKLKQALDKIDEQGRVITLLVQKLQDAGQSVNLTKDIGRP
jgi:hypothetical protein